MDDSVAEQVHAACAGDHRAFTHLVRECDGSMRRLAVRLLGNQTAMDDALQDAYVKAYRAIGDFEGGSRFSTWLYTIVYRTCLDHLRARSSRSEVGLEVVGELSLAGSDHAERHALLDVLDRAVGSLPPDQAAVVVLVDVDGLSYGDAATVLDVSEGTIASRLSRARQTLRQTLEDDLTQRRQP